MQSALGADLKGMVRITSTQLRLDLTGIEVDFIALSELSARIARRRGLVDAKLAEEVSQLLESTAGGEFLSGFEQLEHQVTAGRGGAREVVEQARVAIASWRADLATALAQHLEAIGRPQASIAFLRSALAQSPEREDLARLLVAAYMQTGQIERAEEVRLDYRLSQGEVR
ncbi:MAG: tetratricopeptide repeat protein [Chloroflexi bacterium]|nr:MAG: tetratricopeptide repeat protein [Chloroflexota bacterium]